MRRVGENSYTEIYFTGCNPSFVVTSEGVVMIDSPFLPIDSLKWRERIAEFGKPKYLINTEPHIDHISGNQYFPGVEVIGQVGIKERYYTDLNRIPLAEQVERAKRDHPDSVFLLGHPDYPPNPPTRIFSESFTLQVGKHTFQCHHIPGHTKPQTAIFCPEEGVLFTGDNIFQGTKSWIQEGDPWEWLQALERIAGFDCDNIIPGHGEPCGREYLTKQAEVLHNWIGLVEGFIDKGMTEEEALRQPIEVKKLDPYPIGQGLMEFDEMVNRLNVSNIYKLATARRQAKS
ncbi:MAG TPA: MBL fold metallo-hydrolase [Candidatus Binataceae bacterium]|nr:MBL fold metallo-hydrolase [Candidatus Binataceae bacterium]